MNRYQMREHLFSFGDDYTIRDEQGRDRFFVDGRAFSLGDKLSFQDMQGNELVFIRQRLLSFGPSYEITRDGELVAVVQKKLFTLLRCKFVVDVPGPDDLLAEGDLFEHEYEFRRGSQRVASVSKRWLSLRDSYGVEVADGEDDVLVLAAAVVIDQCCHADKR